MPGLLPEFVVGIVVCGQLALIHFPLVAVCAAGCLQFRLLLSYHRNIHRLCLLFRCWLGAAMIVMMMTFVFVVDCKRKEEKELNVTKSLKTSQNL